MDPAPQTHVRKGWWTTASDALCSGIGVSARETAGTTRVSVEPVAKDFTRFAAENASIPAILFEIMP
jgi:hypothetical protein